MNYLEFEKALAEIDAKIEALHEGEQDTDPQQLKRLQSRCRKLEKDTYENLSFWQKVQLSRHPNRPYFLDYVEHLFDDFVELHGDRRFGDDAAIVAGFARFEGRHVAVIGQQKGRTTRQKMKRNFAMAHPEGYRKACRIMNLAHRFKRPLFTFIDTPGAYPGLGAEERGQSEAIGEAILTMSQLRVPVITTVIGEGGSGGALALGVANRVLMLGYATYSVITPEGCASILWRDASKAPEASEQLKLLADDAARLGVTDTVIPEPLGGAHRHPQAMAKTLKGMLAENLAALDVMSEELLISDRYAKFREIGVYASN